MRKVVCLDNSLGSNKDYYKIGGIYNLKYSESRLDKICYILHNVNAKNGEHIVTAVDTLNGKIYFDSLDKYRKDIINKILNEV